MKWVGEEKEVIYWRIVKNELKVKIELVLLDLER